MWRVETRSIAPDEVKRGGKLIEVRGPRIISLVFICIIFFWGGALKKFSGIAPNFKTVSAPMQTRGQGRGAYGARIETLQVPRGWGVGKGCPLYPWKGGDAPSSEFFVDFGSQNQDFRRILDTIFYSSTIWFKRKSVVARVN